MSVSSSHYPRTNEIISRSAALFELVSRDEIGALLEELDYDWVENTFNQNASIVRTLVENDLVTRDGTSLHLNRAGLLFLGRLLLHFDQKRLGDSQFGNLADKYKDFEVISAGKNSIVMQARHRLLDTKVVLKLVRPGASLDLAKSMGRLSGLSADSAIVFPIDFTEVWVKDALGKSVKLECLVFPLASGLTFREFLSQTNHHLNSQLVIAFARQVGYALRELEATGGYHGDLHEANILVDQHAKSGVAFRIVDLSYGAMGSLPLEFCRNDDLSNFKQHLWRIMSIQKSFTPSMSLRKYIGTSNYLKIMRILSAETRTFSDVCRALESNLEFNNHQTQKAKFVQDNFKSPVSFRLQRYEEITDQSVAVSLFVPYVPLMQKITSFGSIYVSGNRGSGKSTYLASLAFFHDTDSSSVDFRETFGIYFPCRQGEFRPLASRATWTKEQERKFVTNALSIKIVRRTLEMIAAGVTAERLAYPAKLDRLKKLVTAFVPHPGIVSVDHDIQTELDNLVSTMIRVETDQISRLVEGGSDPSAERGGRYLLEFFGVIRETFPELGGTRFHLLFDDAGDPYVPSSVQRAICDLILTSNSIFCTKLSAEKLTFEFQSSDQKALENGQDYFEHDISQVLFIGPGAGGLNRKKLEEYFRRIVEQRLRHFGYRSTIITDYLGDEHIPLDRLLKLLAKGRNDAYYCGWTTVWNIADRTPRNLLEIVSEIFSIGKIDRNSTPEVVPQRDQHTAIRIISEKRLDSLSQISGSIIVRGAKVSLGRHIFETTTALGSTFRTYLKADAARKPPRQHLAIERNDLGQLSPESETVLKKLITFGILDAGKSGYARDDDVKKPFYVLNRIYCPAFHIGYRRDDHLRLSKGKLEWLLLDPQKFLREGTQRLREAKSSALRDLFDFGDK